MDKASVLDASAVLALLKREPGWERVAEAVSYSHISAVNLAEVASLMGRYGAAPRDIRTALSSLPFRIESLDEEDAYQVGFLHPQAKNLSLGDRSCLALGKRLAAPVLTSDRAWKELEDPLGVEVVLVR